jgi:hypothetical protein
VTGECVVIVPDNNDLLLVVVVSTYVAMAFGSSLKIMS